MAPHHKATHSRMPRKLDHLDGGRTVLALWIVLHHFPDTTSDQTMLQGDRAHVAVSYFVVLSGFVTHWVYGRPERWDGRLLRFYARRLDRVVLTSWLGMVVIIILELLAIGHPGVGAAARDAREGHRYFHGHENISVVLAPERLLYATQGSNPRLADPRQVWSATHTFEPRLGQGLLLVSEVVLRAWRNF